MEKNSALKWAIKQAIEHDPTKSCGDCAGLTTMGDRDGICRYCSAFSNRYKKHKWTPKEQK